MRFGLTIFLLSTALSSVAHAEGRSSFALEYDTVDMTVTSGGVSLSGDLTGYTGSFSIISDGGIGFLASFTSASGTLATADIDMTATQFGVGYELMNTIDREDGSGVSLIAGLGYTSADGTATIGGQSISVDDTSTTILGRADGRISRDMSFVATVNIDTAGDIDPTFGVGASYDISDSGSIEIGYSSNNTSEDGVTTKMTGWSIGYVTRF